jgi:hypothetical protein
MDSEKLLYTLSCLVEQRYRDEYAAGLDLWRDIERKAQGVVAIAGIVLTGLFAIVRAEHVQAIGLATELCVVVISLGLAVVSAVSALWTRRLSTPPQAYLLEQSAGDIAKVISKSSADEHLSRFVEGQLNDWKLSVAEIKRANEKKAQDLNLSHKFVLLSMLSLLIATITAVATHVSQG